LRNGGSAATASHLANDLGKAAKRLGRTPIRAFCLTDNVPWLTAVANDDGYENVFTGQLDSHLRPGDVVIAISASGSSNESCARSPVGQVAGCDNNWNPWL